MGPRFRDARRFAEGESNILIASEFGGRGIDWPEVDHVVNFQMPTSTISWLHRVGRTGRMGRRGLVTNFVAGKDQRLAELIRSRLAIGKDLHAAFSRKRSLTRTWRSDTDSGEGGAANQFEAEDGTYRLHGGLEVFEERLKNASNSGGTDETLLGYLSLDGQEETGAMGTNLRKRAKGRRETEAAVGEDDAESSDPLAQFRRQLLDSDSSEDENEEELFRPGYQSIPGPRHVDEGAVERTPFRWSQVGSVDADAEAQAVVGPESRRQLLNRGDARKKTQGRRRSEPPPGGVGSRKGLGVQAANRAAAARNYAEPDDDLLL